MTNAEINIYKGDPTKGHEGWMYTITLGADRFDGGAVYGSLSRLAAAAGAHLERLSRLNAPLHWECRACGHLFWSPTKLPDQACVCGSQAWVREAQRKGLDE